ncbi:MAG TPA: hypothetical protein VN688_02115 [Gemmataceae bacterium]|nr:hypothetical protein [Gemmataceae bacterium]
MHMVAEMTEAELTKIAEVTFNENAGDAPPQQEEKPDEPAIWKPRGDWKWSDHSPVAMGIDGLDVVTLSLKFQAANLGRQRMLSMRDDLAGRARSTLLAALQKHEAFQRWAEVNAEHRLAVLRVNELEQKAAALQKEKLQLTAKPKGSGPKLVSNKAEQEENARLLEAARAEQEAFAPIADEARQTVEALTRQMAQESARASYDEHMAEIDAKLADFAARNSETLTELAAMVQGRKAAVQAYELTAFALAQLHDPQPSPEQLNASD